METDTMTRNTENDDTEETDVNLRQYAPDVNYDNLLTVLEHSDYDWEEVDYDWALEYVFEAEITPVHTLRLYSSIDQRDNEGRECGSDRFRLLLIDGDTGMPLMARAKQKNRVIKWRPNLLDAMDEVADPVEQINECPECGRALVRVPVKDGDDFWSCSTYHADDLDYCGYSANLDVHK